MRKESGPLVSCIITCYNRQHCIKLAIDSVLKQTYTNLELIIVDDYSTDESFKIIQSYDHDKRVRIVRHDVNGGLPAISRNTGLNYTSGDYIAFLDADDIWSDNKIELQMNTLLSNENEIIGVGSNVRFSQEAAKISAHGNNSVITLDNILLSKSVALSSLIYKDQGLFFNEDSSFRGVEDLEFQMRLLKKSGKNLYKIGEPLVYYSIEEGSISSNFNNYSNLLNVIEYYRSDIEETNYLQAKHVAYLKLGLKSIKLKTDSYPYFKKSIKYHDRSVYRIFVSGALLILSLMPNWLSLYLLQKIYKAKTLSFSVFNKITS